MEKSGCQHFEDLLENLPMVRCMKYVSFIWKVWDLLKSLNIFCSKEKHEPKFYVKVCEYTNLGEISYELLLFLRYILLINLGFFY